MNQDNMQETILSDEGDSQQNSEEDAQNQIDDEPQNTDEGILKNEQEPITLQEEDIMKVTGHDEEAGIFLDKMAVYNHQKETNDNFLKTRRNTIVSKHSYLKNPTNILAQKIVISPKAIIRSDLCTIKIGTYSLICDSVILKPPMTNHGGMYENQFTSITIGKYTIIGPNTIVKANLIGDCVRIGKNCILEENVVIEDNCIIEDNSILSENTLVPKNTIFGGRPGRYLKKCPFGTQQNHMIEAIHYYQSVLETFSN